jgi:hypothetical protein
MVQLEIIEDVNQNIFLEHILSNHSPFDYFNMTYCRLGTEVGRKLDGFPWLEWHVNGPGRKIVLSRCFMNTHV